MSLAVKCPGCQVGFRVKESHAGKQARCPKCKTQFQIPALEPQGVGAGDDVTETSADPRSALHGSDSGEQLFDPFGVTQPSAAAAADEGFPFGLSSEPGEPSEGLTKSAFDFSAAATSGPAAGLAPAGLPSQPYGGPQSGYPPGNDGGSSGGLPLGVIIGAAGGGLAVLALLIGATIFLLSGSTEKTKPVAEVEETSIEEGHDRGRGRPRLNRSSLSGGAADTDLNPRGPQPDLGNTDRSKVVDFIDNGTVRIDCKDPRTQGWIGLGSGFVVDVERRLVVTNYHVVRNGYEAIVKFKKYKNTDENSPGERYGIVGYRALDIGSDLAIIEVNALPAYAEALPLASATAKLAGTRAVALGAPLGVEFIDTEGDVLAEEVTSEMEFEHQIFLADTPADNVWLRHDVDIQPGNSGGPLVNFRGEVVGVNTWKSPEFNYSSHIKHLHKLMGEINDEAEPLIEHYDPRERRRSIPVHLFEKLVEKAEEAKFSATGDEDWTLLKLLAYAVTVSESEDDLQKQRQELFDKLREYAWTEADHIKPAGTKSLEILNDEDEPRPFVFFFGKVVGTDNQLNDIDRAVGIRRRVTVAFDGVAAQQQVLVLAGELSQASSLSPGDPVLILGVRPTEVIEAAAANPNDLPVLLSWGILRYGSGPSSPTPTTPGGPVAAAGELKPKLVFESGPDMPHTGILTAMAIDPAGVLLATAGEDSSLRLWNVQTGAWIHTFNGLPQINDLVFTKDGRSVLAACQDRTMRIFNIDTLKELDIREGGHMDAALAVVELSDETIVTAGKDKRVVFWGSDRSTILNVPGVVTAMAAVPGKPVLILGTEEGVVLQIERNGDQIDSRPLGQQPTAITSLAVGTSGNQLVIGNAGSESEVAILNLALDQVDAELKGHTDAIAGVAVLDDGERALSVSADGTARLWSNVSDSEVGQLVGHEGALTCVAVTPDGHWAVTGGADKTLRLYDLKPPKAAE